MTDSGFSTSTHLALLRCNGWLFLLAAEMHNRIPHYHIHLLQSLNLVLEDKIDIIFLPFPKESTTMPTWVEIVLPNAATAPLQELWFNNVNSIWLPCIEWHAGHLLLVVVGVFYCQRLRNLWKPHRR